MPLPPHLPAIVIGTLVAVILNRLGGGVETIGSRFTYLLADGTVGKGIPPILLYFEWPWLQRTRWATAGTELGRFRRFFQRPSPWQCSAQ